MPDCQDGFAIVQQVMIESANTTSITFWTRSSSNTLEKFTVPAATVCTVPPAQAPAPVSLKHGAVGNLYMNRTGWKTKAANGATIYKSDNEDQVLFKWPQCSPYRTIENLAVPPTRISVVGTATTTARAVTVDAWGSECAPSQSINWNAAQKITLALSAEGKHKYGVATLEVWPTSIEVTAHPAGGATGTVDILDVEKADFVQHLTWTNRHASVTLRLSAVGFGEFDVAPDNLRRLAEGYQVDYRYAAAIIKEWEIFGLENSQNTELKNLVILARKRFAALPGPPSLPVPEQFGK